VHGWSGSTAGSGAYQAAEAVVGQAVGWCPAVCINVPLGGLALQALAGHVGALNTVGGALQAACQWLEESIYGGWGCVLHDWMASWHRLAPADTREPDPLTGLQTPFLR
jgi:hypothetical protein